MGAPCGWYVIRPNPLSQLQRSTQPQPLARSSSVDQGLGVVNAPPSSGPLYAGSDDLHIEVAGILARGR